MQIIKLDATPSTNSYLKKLASAETLEDFTVIVTDNQFIGRGQMGSNWLTEAGKNLTFSVLKKLNGFKTGQHAKLNCAVSLALYRALLKLGVPDLSIKWPNDIMSGASKVCGILIENSFKGDAISQSIIGVGLNVNQESFGELTNARSLYNILGVYLDLDEVLLKILNQMIADLNNLNALPFETIKSQYHNVLYRKDVWSEFLDAKDNLIIGMIRGINDAGELSVMDKKGFMGYYGLKELKLLL